MPPSSTHALLLLIRVVLIEYLGLCLLHTACSLKGGPCSVKDVHSPYGFRCARIQIWPRPFLAPLTPTHLLRDRTSVFSLQVSICHVRLQRDGREIAEIGSCCLYVCLCVRASPLWLVCVGGNERWHLENCRSDTRALSASREWLRTEVIPLIIPLPSRFPQSSPPVLPERFVPGRMGSFVRMPEEGKGTMHDWIRSLRTALILDCW